MNVRAPMASSPAVLAAYAGISAAIAEHGSLSGRVREAVALAVAATNRGDYCQAAHTRSGTAAGLSAEEMVQIRAGKDVTDQLVSVAVQVARDAAAHDGYVESTTWAAAADAEWSQEELAQMSLPIIANVFSSYSTTTRAPTSTCHRHRRSDRHLTQGEGTMTATTAPRLSLTGTSLVHGVAGGLAGGLVFGVLMQMMDMMPMVAMLVGSEAVAVGWVVHLAISAFIGAVFAVILGSRVSSLASGLGLGVAWGLIWWVLGALIAMPARLGMPLFEINTMSLQSLMGHVLFGAVLGAVVAVLGRRGSVGTSAP